LKFPDFIPNVGSWQKILFLKQDGVSETGCFQNFLETGNKREFQKHDPEKFPEFSGNWKQDGVSSAKIQ
jgi:hypothetical protein